MSSPPPFAGNPFSHLFGSFQRAVNDPQVTSQPGGVQAYVWASVRQDFLSKGDPLPAGSFQAVNQLLGLAGQQRRAAGELSKAVNLAERTGLVQGITGQMIAPAIDTAQLGARPGGAQYRILYEAIANVEGQDVHLPLTHDAGRDLPLGTDSLQATIEEAAQLALADYGYEFGGVAAVTSIQAY